MPRPSKVNVLSWSLDSQKQASLIRQLEEELRMAHMRNPDAELRQHLDALYAEKEHMAKEIFLLRETIKELELRIETQKQTLASRDESIKKLMEMLQNKGVGSHALEEQRVEMERLRGRLIESEARARHLETMLDTRDRDMGKQQKPRGSGVVTWGARTAADGSASPRCEERLRSTYGSHIAMMEGIIDTKPKRTLSRKSVLSLESLRRATRIVSDKKAPSLPRSVRQL
ncbi:hypothetical protein ISCGN_012975 [Ixodes scapularis]